jgi:hypothetical protein
MTSSSKYRNLFMVAAISVFLFACESAPKLAATPKTVVKHREVKAASTPVVAPAETAPTAPTIPAISAEAAALKLGITLYDNGDYNGAIRKLAGSAEIWNGRDKITQVNALKTMAFSYCVTSRIGLCRQKFEQALKLDLDFMLTPSEIGHPIWGPVFAKAKKQR